MIARHLVRGVAALTVVSTMLVAQAASASNIYVKASEASLNGESTVSGHANEIEAESAQFQVTNALHGAAVGNGTASRPVFGEFVITKAVDKSSPNWFGYMVGGNRIPSLVVTFAKPSAGGGQVFLKITLTNAVVTEYSVDGAGTTSTPNATKETIGLSYQRVKMEYGNVTSSGGSPSSSAGWDVTSNSKI